SPRRLVLETLEDRVVPSAGVQEQYLLSLINRFRGDPTTELSLLLNSLDPNVQNDLAKFGVDQTALLNQTFAFAPPLAWNDALSASALAHSQAMLAAGQSSSQLPGEPDLATRIANAGYDNITKTAENIDAFARSLLEADASFAIDWGNNPPTG